MASLHKGRLKAHRIGKPGPFPLFSGEGARINGARWNSLGHSVIYAALSYGTCLLEQIVHLNGQKIPKSLRRIEIGIPPRVSRETLSVQTFTRWDTLNSLAPTQKYGDRWVNSLRSAVLIVPSVVAPLDWNVLINPAHPDAQFIKPTSEQPVIVDPRL